MSIRAFCRYASLSTSSLRALHATYEVFGVFPDERYLIAHELAMRGWAEAIEQELDRTITWCRGGLS